MVEETSQTPHAWLVVADRQVLEAIARSGAFEMPIRGPLAAARPGEKVVAYVRDEQVFGGLGEVTEALQVEAEVDCEKARYSIGLRLTVLEPTQGRDPWGLRFLAELPFPCDKERWAASAIAGIKGIPPADYEVFAGQLTPLPLR